MWINKRYFNLYTPGFNNSEIIQYPDMIKYNNIYLNNWWRFKYIYNDYYKYNDDANKKVVILYVDKYKR